MQSLLALCCVFSHILQPLTLSHSSEGLSKVRGRCENPRSGQILADGAPLRLGLRNARSKLSVRDMIGPVKDRLMALLGGAAEERLEAQLI